MAKTKRKIATEFISLALTLSLSSSLQFSQLLYSLDFRIFDAMATARAVHIKKFIGSVRKQVIAMEKYKSLLLWWQTTVFRH